MVSKEKLEALVTAISEGWYDSTDGRAEPRSIQLGHFSNELINVLEEDENFTEDMKNSIYDAVDPDN